MEAGRRTSTDVGVAFVFSFFVSADIIRYCSRFCIEGNVDSCAMRILGPVATAPGSVIQFALRFAFFLQAIQNVSDSTKRGLNPDLLVAEVPHDSAFALRAPVGDESLVVIVNDVVGVF